MNKKRNQWIVHSDSLLALNECMMLSVIQFNDRLMLLMFDWYILWNGKMNLQMNNACEKYVLINGSSNNLIVEFITQLKLDHHGKPGNIGRPNSLSMGLFSSAYPWSRPLGLETRIYRSRAQNFATVYRSYNLYNEHMSTNLSTEQ